MLQRDVGGQMSRRPIVTRADFIYTTGRLFAVFTKPFLLFVANNFLAEGTALGLAVAFLASGLALVCISAGPERRFYARYFSTETGVNGISFYLFVVTVALLGLLGTLIAGGISLYYTKSVWLPIAVGTFFVSEKLADEMLRLRLFERAFTSWGYSSIARSVLQLVLTTIVLLLLGIATPAWLLVLVLALANFAVFLRQLPLGLIRVMRPDRLRTVSWLGRLAIKSTAANLNLWAIALLGSSIAYLDRLVALLLDKSTLPIFTLIVMCFSIMQLSVDFYYVSRHRRDFLHGTISIANALSSLEFVKSAGLGFACSMIACVLILNTSRNGAEFPLGYVLSIAVIQVSIAVSAIPREVLYWSRFFGRILAIELFFWALCLTTALASWALGLSVVTILSVVAFCIALRLSLYVVVCARIDALSNSLGEYSNR